MKTIYLILCVIGFIVPNIYVAKISIESGNLLLWLDPVSTISGMFANDIATAFVVDLLFTVLVFFYWTWSEAGRLGMKRPWPIWLLTMMFGIAGALPLFLYKREKFLRAEKT